MYGLGPEKSLRLVYETFYLAIALLFTSSSESMVRMVQPGNAYFS